MSDSEQELIEEIIEFGTEIIMIAFMIKLPSGHVISREMPDEEFAEGARFVINKIINKTREVDNAKGGDIDK